MPYIAQHTRLLPLFVRRQCALVALGIMSCIPLNRLSSLTVQLTSAGGACMTWNDLCTDLLPPQAPLHIETGGITAGERALDVAVTSAQALCPTRTQPSTHVHSHSRRTLADLPWATTPMQLHRRVRRFWCETRN